VLAGKDTRTNKGLCSARLVATVGAENLILLGELPSKDLLPWLANAHLAVYPSRCEAFGLSLVEAMSQGALAVGSTAIDSRILCHGHSGIVCDTQNARSLAATISEALDLPPDTRDRLKDGARRVAMDRYSYEVGIERNLEFYRKLVSGCPEGRL
jgi:glycosyltransferase involved in cell wall biosynthesis